MFLYQALMEPFLRIVKVPQVSAAEMMHVKNALNDKRSACGLETQLRWTWGDRDLTNLKDEKNKYSSGGGASSVPAVISDNIKKSCLKRENHLTA